MIRGLQSQFRPGDAALRRRRATSQFPFRLLATAVVLGLTGVVSQVSAGSTNRVQLFTKVQMIRGVEFLRAAPVVEGGQVRYVLVAPSDALGGYVQIAPSCVGADRVTWKEARERVAAIEASHRAAARTAAQAAFLAQVRARQTPATASQSQAACIGGG